ncbi:DUF4340 domain-containing protein [Pendulispora brunnea]|uniref:DUF4340 domain-containing protein n=1 Tax=Pendulispora brunnea TaxID=2905690 RepID=A0ABZ2K518_9BACT
MSGTQKIAIGGAILVVLVYAVYAQSKKDESMGVASKETAAEKPVLKVDLKEGEDLDKISITNADKGEVVLEKKGDKWELTKPVSFPANQGNVKSLIDNLKELKTGDLIDANPSEDIKKSYQLDTEHAVHVVAYKGGEKKADDYFGKSGGRGQMAIAAGNPGIYSVSGYSGYLYGREVKAWRDTEIFKFDDANVTSLVIEKSNEIAAAAPAGDAGAPKKAGGTFSFTKGAKWAGTWNGQAIARFDEEKVKDALRIFKALNADDFGDGKGVDVTGLDKPQATVTIGLKDNAGKFVLKVGKTSSGSERYATKDGSETVYVLPSAVSDWVTADVTKFQQAADGGAPKAPAMPPGMPGMPPGMMPPGHGAQ